MSFREMRKNKQKRSRKGNKQNRRKTQPGYFLEAK